MDDRLFQQLLNASPTPAAPTPAVATQGGDPGAVATPTPPPPPIPDAPAPDAPPAPGGASLQDLMQPGRDAIGNPTSTIDAVLGGAARSLFETKDFLTGDTAKQDQSGVRQSIEAGTAAATKDSLANSAASTIAQFATGMLGAGKIVGALKMVPKVAEGITALGHTVETSAKAAAVGAVAFDPHQERLSNLAEQVPIIGEPLFGWLAAHPDDSAALGRFKAALESIGLDAALIGTFTAAGKVYKAWRSGTPEELHAATEELQAATPPETAAEGPAAPAGEAKPPEATPVAQTPEATPAAPTASTEPPPATASNDNPAGPPQEPNAGAVAGGAPVENPSINPKVKPTTEDAEAIIASTRADLQAIDENGSVQGAVDAGHKFAPGAGIPWNKLNLPGEVDDFVATVADRLSAGMDAVKGGAVLTDASAMRRLTGIASYFNIDPGTIVGRIQKAGEAATRMVSDMEAAYLLSNRMHMDAFDLASRIGLGDLTGFATREAAVAEFQRQVAIGSSMFASGQSMRAAFGRGLRRLQPAFAIPQELVDNINNLGGEKLMQLFRNTMKDPDALKLVAQPSFMRKAAEELGFVVQNNLLWGYGTHIANTLGNAYMLVSRPAERIIGGTVQQVLGNPQGAEIRREALKQYSYMVSSWTDSLPSVWEALKAADGVLDPRRTGVSGEANRAMGLNSPEWLPMNSTTNILHNAYVHALRPLIGVPTRFLTAADEMSKQTVYRSKVAAGANMEGIEAGLAGQDLSKFVGDKVKAAFDENGVAIDKEALQEARVATFSQDLQSGTLGKWVSQGVAQHPLLRLVLPFTQTPTNIMRYTQKLTPGLNLLQTEFRESLLGHLGEEAQASAIGQAALSLVAVPAIAYSGLNLTGGGPQDPKVRSEWLATGARPYSLVVEIGGTKHYFPIGRVDPIALPFGIVADIQDYLHTGADASKAQAAISALTFGLVKQMANKTYLQGVTRAADAFSNPKENLMKFGQSIETMMVPFSSALRNYNPDPFMRNARDLADALVAITPGFSQNLPANYDGFGQPILSRNSFISSSPPDPVTAEMQRLEMLGYTLPPVTPTQNHADLRDVTMVDGRNAFEVYQQLGGKPTDNARPLKEVVGKIMESAAYARAPDGYSNTRGTKTWLLEEPVVEYRKAALNHLMMDKNVRDALGAEQQRVVNAYHTATDPKAAAKGPWDTIRDIGAHFGMSLQPQVPQIPPAVPPQQ